jgi:hypothetical protein
VKDLHELPYTSIIHILQGLTESTCVRVSIMPVKQNLIKLNILHFCYMGGKFNLLQYVDSTERQRVHEMSL